MRVELPEIRRCCCCIPLRYGLLVAGYIRLVFVLFMSVISIAALVHLWNYSYYGTRDFTEDIVMLSILVLILIVDLCLCTIFLVGGHQKCPKKLRVFYIYNIVFTSLFTLYFVISAVLFLYWFHHYPYFHVLAAADLFITRVSLGSGFIGSLVYFTLLLRTEINKLNSNCQFRFNNMTTEAQCSLENVTHTYLNENNGTAETVYENNTD